MTEPPVESDEEKFRKRRELFFHQLGVAITEWAFVDEELFHICADILRAPHQQHVAIIYYRTPGLDIRVKLVVELMSTLFPPRKSGEHPEPPEKLWKEITGAISAELPIRRQLAHSPTYTIAKTDPPIPRGWPQSIPEEHRDRDFRVVDVWLASAMSPTERLRGAAEREDLTTERIAQHIARIRTIYERLENFRTHELPKLLAAFPPQ
jgi:hypothetical protein